MAGADDPALTRARLEGITDTIRVGLGAAHHAREEALPACRACIRGASRAIRSVHRGEVDAVAAHLVESEEALRTAQRTLDPFPALVHAGFLHDAEKEYAEARLTEALVAGTPAPGPDELGVAPTAWMRGLSEAASELRRNLLDRLREGGLERGEVLLGAMDDVYDVLSVVDYPDALTNGLRRSLDQLRAVLERSRGDVTTTVLQTRLQRAIEGADG
ncbi:MAG: haloacid dehalogenase [Iamia sp.]